MGSAECKGIQIQTALISMLLGFLGHPIWCFANKGIIGIPIKILLLPASSFIDKGAIVKVLVRRKRDIIYSGNAAVCASVLSALQRGARVFS